MCTAIEAAYEVDEVKDIRDKALAWEIYSQQAKNVENERRACEIRLRAERKAGQLLKQMTERGERARGGEAGRRESVLTTLADLGVSRDQSSNWQKLADVPEDQFEVALKGLDKPTTSGILAAATKAPPRDERSLWLWGRLQDFERDGLLDLDPNDLLGIMSEHMQVTTLRLAPLVAEWLRRIGDGL
jgi:hypothetical protein